jgi:urocanate hydratase
MYGQMTAGSWIYIGTQGILQGTYETLAALARRTSAAAGRPLTVTAGLGGMGGAQPLAVTMNEGVALVVEVDPHAHRAAAGDAAIWTRRPTPRRGARPRARMAARRARALDRPARQRRRRAARTGAPRHHARRRHRSDLGARPAGGLRAGRAHAWPRPIALRASDPAEYERRAIAAMGRHVAAMLAMQRAARWRSTTATTSARRRCGRRGRCVRDPGFVPEYIRPLFCEGKGPFRWAALSGDPEDIRVTDARRSRCSPTTPALPLDPLAGERVAFQGLPARIFWLGLRRARALRPAHQRAGARPAPSRRRS